MPSITTEKKQQQTQTEAPAKPAATPFIGSTGNKLFGGQYTEDYLTSLQGKQALEVYEEMRRGDGQVKMLLTATKSPIKAAAFQHEPRDSEDSEQEEIKAFLDWHWFENPFFSFQQWLSEALTCLEFGHAAHEVIYAAHDHPDFGPVHIVAGLGFRKQDTIERWIVEPRKGLVAIDQCAYGDTVDGMAQNVRIPAENLVVFTMEQEGDNYEGVSLLRPCYGAWFRKQHLLKMNAIGGEKAAIGTPVGKYPSGASDDQRVLFETVLTRFAVNENNYIMVPEGYEVEVVKLPFDSEKLMASVNYEDGQMARAFLWHVLELGQNGNGGAYALGSDLSDIALNALQHIGNLVAQKMEALNRKLVLWNFGDKAQNPYVRCNGINSKAGKEFADTLKVFIDGKVITPDATLEAHVRETYNLPAADEVKTGEERTAEKEAEKMAGLPGAGKKPQPGEEKAESDSKEGKEEGGEEDPPPGAKRKQFSEDAPWSPFRELTRYERSLNFSEMLSERQQAEQNLTRTMRMKLTGIADYVLRNLEKRLEQGPTSRIKLAARIAIETKDYEKSLLREMAKAVSLGKAQAARDLAAKGQAQEFAEDSLKSQLEFLPPHVQEALKARAKKQAEIHAGEMRKILDMKVIEADELKYSDKQLLSDLEDELGIYISGSKVESAARTVASQAVNQGREGFFFDEKNLKSIQAFQYSAILDGRTTDICLSLDGKIFKPNDPETDRLRPPNHHGCRSILIPITVNEGEVELTGLEVDPSNPSLLDEYKRRGKAPPDMPTIKKSRNL